MRRLLGFLRKYLVRDTVYCLTYLLFVWQKNYRERARFFGYDEFLEEAKKRTTIRLGDGEFGIIHYSFIHYQKFDSELRKKLIEIIKNYSADSPYMVGIPVFVNNTNHELESIHREKVFLWMQLKITYRLIFNKAVKYFDSHIFYRDGRALDFFTKIREGKKTYIVTEKKNIEKIKESSKISNKESIHFIETPSEGAFAAYEKIKKEIQDILIDKENSVVFLACGPSAKIIAYELSREGILCHDIGFGIEMMLTDESYEYKI